MVLGRFTEVISAFPLGDWVTLPSRFSAITGKNNALKFVKLNAGDVNGSRISW